MDEIQKSIVDAIKIQVNEKIKDLQFDKTCYGKVVAIRDDVCDVEINGEMTQCKIRNGLQISVNDIVLVRLINNDFSNKFADAKLGTVHAQASGGKKVARFVIGTSTAGWTLEDCDYLCDGTDDQKEIIQALNALPATGGEVVILDGTYNIMASINIPKDNVSIRGSGNATTLKRMYNSTNKDSGSTAKGLITLNGKSGFKIQGLQIDGNKAIYTSIYNHGIYLHSSSNNMVTGNTCNNNYSGGIYLSSSSNSTVTGNICNNNRCGIRLSSSSNNTVTGNTCIRGTGQTRDYTLNEYTILLFGTANRYNLISSNNCMGRAVSIGGIGNSTWGNKFDNTDDLP